MAQTTTTGSSATSMPMRTPLDLFVHELSDIYSAENIIIGMLDDAVKVVTNDQLAQGLREHQQQTRQHAKNVEQVFQILGQSPHQVTCYAAEGLAKSAKEGAAQSQSPDVTDGLITGGASETEHLEIAAYTGLIKMAQALNQDNLVVELLRENLRQEEQTLLRLEKIADVLNAKGAKMMDGMISQQSQSSGAAATH